MTKTKSHRFFRGIEFRLWLSGAWAYQANGLCHGEPDLLRAVPVHSWWLCIAVLVLACGVLGCHTVKPLAPADLGAPGWYVRQGQAVWRPSRSRPEIAGELLVASRPNGDSLVQFTKTPFPIVLARTSGEHWQIQFGPDARTFGGRGIPPARFIWPRLAACLTSGAAPPKRWTFWSKPDGAWRFENRSTGETLEGFLGP
jgi:hypothetical protein